MASDNEVLFTVSKINVFDRIQKIWVFRSREAARIYAKAKRKNPRGFTYKTGRATWGPEQ